MIAFIDYLKGYKKVKNTNYFDYPASIRKNLLVNAVRMANEMQFDLVKKHKAFVSTKHNFNLD